LEGITLCGCEIAITKSVLGLGKAVILRVILRQIRQSFWGAADRGLDFEV